MAPSVLYLHLVPPFHSLHKVGSRRKGVSFFLSCLSQLCSHVWCRFLGMSLRQLRDEALAELKVLSNLLRHLWNLLVSWDCFNLLSFFKNNTTVLSWSIATVTLCKGLLLLYLFIYFVPTPHPTDSYFDVFNMCFIFSSFVFLQNPLFGCLMCLFLCLFV